LIAGHLEQKRIIVNKLIDSGINITPEILELILNLDRPLEKINQLIKEASFSPSFNGHLTLEFLKQIQNKEILKALKRHTVKLDISIKKSKEDKNENSKSINNSEELTTNQAVLNNPPKSPISDGVLSNIDATSQLNHSTDPLIYINPSKKIDEKKINLSGTTKSVFSFNPTAKDYNPEYELLKDPTGKLYTNGDYSDFFELTLDKFNKLKNLMRKRQEVLSASNINNILRNTQNVDLSTMGFVKEIRQTKKGNYFITLEDLTGILNILIRQDSENRENVRVAERIISDQMIFVEGTYNPGEKGKSGILFVDYITKIDIPTGYKPNKSPDPVSIVLLSDTHIGSREFEEDLWKRFIDFLNGRLGNKKLRDIAGRVKYIIINGDLVDGIGVYPSQKDDLTISDIYQQYKKTSELLSGIPDHIKIFYSSGNHDPVRNAIPRPAVPKKYVEALVDIGVTCVGNPTTIKTHNVNTLSYHGDSMLDLNMLIAGLEHDKTVETMKELLICRHLAPIYGKKTQIAPTNKDWLVIDEIPDIFHTGHLHINGIGKYRNVLLVNSGCFQSQTAYMESFGIHPTPGIVPIIELDSLRSLEIDLKTV